MNSIIQEIISTVENGLPTNWETAFVGCFHEGFKMVVNQQETDVPVERIQELFSTLREESQSQGEEWQMAVFGFDRAGRVNVYLGDESEDWMEKAGL